MTLILSSKRKTVRRAVQTVCDAVALEGFRGIGKRVLDLSHRGMLIAGTGEVELGEEVIVSFAAPYLVNRWLDAEAEVCRVVQGRRPTDAGYAIGLRFTYVEREVKNELLTRLAGLPPPVPQRQLRHDYAETVRRLALAA